MFITYECAPMKLTTVEMKAAVAWAVSLNINYVFHVVALGVISAAVSYGNEELSRVPSAQFSHGTVVPQGQYWAGRAPPPNNGNYQYGRR